MSREQFDADRLLKEVTEFQDDLASGRVDIDDQSRARLEILRTLLDSFNAELRYLQLREDGVVKKHPFFEGGVLTLEDADTIKRAEAVYSECERRMSAH